MPSKINAKQLFFCCSLCALLLLPGLAHAFQTRLLSSNPGFEDGTAGWNNTQIESLVLTRDWVPGYESGGGFFDALGDLGASLVRVRGLGVWGQTLEVATESRAHILNAHAFKKSSSGVGDGGYACVAVSYYDANWREVDRILIPIDGQKATPNRGIGDGLNFYSWGIQVPANAAHAFLFAYTSAGTDVFMDQVALFDYSTTQKTILSSNLVKNPDFARLFTGQDSCLGVGAEFWETDFDWMLPYTGLLGSPNQPESAYQFVPVKPGATYSLVGFGYKFGQADMPAGFGIDIYDKNWNRISSWAQNLYDVEEFTGSPLLGRRITFPANAAHASVWIWVDKTDGQGLVTRLELFEQEAVASNATSMIGYRANLTGGKGGTNGASFSVIYSDVDGIDISTIDLNDAYFVSKINPGTTYPLSGAVAQPMDNDRVVIVNYSYASRSPDADKMILKANEVKDKKGNFVPSKTFSAIPF